MLKVRVAGDNGGGKTKVIFEMACNMAAQGNQVLFIAPTHERAMRLKRLARSDFGGHIIFCGARMVNLRLRDYDCIFIDDLQDFPESKEGGWLPLSESRLSHKKHGLLAYSSTRFAQDPTWVSKAVWWKPWTWNRGYWK